MVVCHSDKSDITNVKGISQRSILLMLPSGNHMAMTELYFGKTKVFVIPNITFYPSALRAGGVLSSRSGRAGGRPGGRLPNLRNPYLCNRLMDFLHSKFCGIVWACSCAPSWSFAHLPHMGLPMGQKLVKFGTNWVQTLWNAYL